VTISIQTVQVQWCADSERNHSSRWG